MLEKNLNRLEEISKELESETITLSKGVELYEEGTKLAVDSLKALEEVKGKIYTIKKESEKMIEEEIK